jgi:hypothetical protein
MIYCEGTPERSGKRSRKAEREGVNFSFQGEGATKKIFHQGGLNKKFKFRIGGGWRALFLFSRKEFFAWLFFRKAMRSRWAKQVKNSVSCGWLFNDLLRASF